MERREKLAWVTAALLHAGLFLARRDVPPAHVRHAEANDTIELSTDQIITPSQHSEASAAPVDGTMEAKGAEGPVPRAPVKGKSAPAEPKGKMPMDSEADAPGAKPDSAADVMGIETKTVLGGAPAWTIPGVLAPMERPKPAPTAAPVARSVDRNIAGKVIEGALQERDHDLGLDAPGAGAAASAVEDAVRSGAVPDHARATFEVRIGANGDVLGVKVATANVGGAPAWERVAQAAKRALKGRKLQTRNSTSATTVVVHVESNMQFPAGNPVKAEVERVCATEMADPMLIGPEDPGSTRTDTRRAALNAGLPLPTSDEVDEQRRNACLPVALRVRGDLSNIGAHRQKVVRSRFSVKRE